jgi:hypothetical protein
MIINSYVYAPPKPIYSFTSFTFTNMGAIESNGPATGANYANSPSPPWGTDPTLFSVNNGLQYWMVPATRSYTITAAGAGNGGSTTTGRGIVLQTTYALTRGQIIAIAVGQQGYISNGNWGGGGGSFVVAFSPSVTTIADAIFNGLSTLNNSNIILIAGGGGGGGGDSASDAQTGTKGLPDSRNANQGGSFGSGGQGGRGGRGYQGAAGGGGFSGDGEQGLGNNGPGGGLAFIKGATGGTDGGGFGGGGGGCREYGSPTGGGGGYSGGAGGISYSSTVYGGGGGSYDGNNAANEYIGRQVNSSFNSEHGYVTIS